MSRYCGEHDSLLVLKAAEHWRSSCLESDGAVFTENSLWTLEHFKQVEQYYLYRLEEGEGDFFQKLEFQLAPAPRRQSNLSPRCCGLCCFARRA